ncbi:MAG: PadR family transcriptional regulator [Enterococcus sp.]
MISSDGIRGYNDAIVLALLQEGDSYGYQIAKEIKQKTQALYIMKETTLYSAFTRLEKLGYIQSYPGEITHGKKRTYYRLTDQGAVFLARKQYEWGQTKIVVNQFLGEG